MTPADAIHEERRIAAKLVAFVAELLCVATVVMACRHAWAWLDRPFPGFLLHQRTTVGMLTRPAWHAGGATVRAGDLIRSVDGVPVTSTGQVFDHAAALAPGTIVRYEVERSDGQRFEIRAPVRVFSGTDLLLTFGIHLVEGIVILTIGFAVFFLRPGNAGTLAFLLFCAFTGWSSVTVFEIETHESALEPLFFLVNVLMPAALIHLGVTFPRERLEPGRARRTVVSAYAFFAAMALVAYLPAHLSHRAWLVAERLQHLAVAGAGVFFLMSLYRGVSCTERDAIDRRRAMVVGIGALVGLVPSGFGLLAVSVWPELLQPWLPAHWLLLTANVFPLSVAWAIVRFNLFGVSFVLRRSVAYVLLTSLMIGSYVGVVLAVHTVFHPRIEVTPYLNTFLVIVYAFLFPPARRLVVAFVDRTLFKTPYDYREVVQQLSHALVSELDLDRILAEVDSALRDTLQLEHAMVLIRPERGGAFVHYPPSRGRNPRREPEADFTLLATSPLARILEQRTTELSKWEVRENPLLRWDRAEALADMERMGANLLVPAVFKGDVVAILSLGAKTSGALFNSEDLSLVRTLADQAAIAIHNARSYRDLATVMAGLEGEVGRRTQELTEANDELRRTLHELRETQGQLLQSKKLASLGELVAGVAHELNNPIGFLYANLDHIERYLARLRTGEGDPAKIHALLVEMIESCREGARRTKAIVQDLRTFSRLDEHERKPTDLNAAIETTLRLLAHRVGRGIEIVKDLAELPLVPCYPGPINQVFMNLLANACDAVGERGQIRISTRMVTDDGTARVRIRIEDSGVGIPPENLERVFDPFFTTKEIGKGTGLGLSITHSIVERHGGTIRVESAPGDGTRFTVELPVAAGETEAASTQPRTSSDESREALAPVAARL